MEQPYEKLEVIGGHVVVAGTGQIGLGQRFCEIVRKAWEDKSFQRTAVEVGKVLCKTTVADFAETGVNKGKYGALVAFPAENKMHLCEFSIDDFQPELKTERLWYCSMGSAQPITDPFLALIREIYWDDGRPNINEAIFAVTWTLDHAIRVNPGGVNGPIRIAVLERDNKGQPMARVLTDDDLGEHRQNVQEAKQIMREFKTKHHASVESVVESVPKV